METVPVQNISLTGNVLLYTQPELLSREHHGSLGVNVAPTRFGFASGAHVSPLTVPEFGPAALSYPIIFVGNDVQPVAVMGLEEGQNLFCTPEKGFEVDAYITCYIRRYPFVLAAAENQPANEEERMLVGIDRGYPFLVEKGEYRLFENGEPTEYTQNCIKFCNDFETQHRMTQSFIQMLKDMDLFEPRSATYTPTNADGTPAEPVTVAQFQAVSETKLNALPDAKINELRSTGALSQIYAHLNSLFGWERLIIRAMARQQAAMDAAASAATGAA